MSNYIAAETSDLYDPNTGKWVGVLDRNGKEQEVATPAAVAAALAGTPVNFIPRTGTLAALAPPNSPSGTAGEIAVFTDTPGLALLKGVAGQADLLTGWGGHRLWNIVTGGGAYTADQLTWPTDCGRLVVRNADGSSNATPSVTLTPGKLLGQRVEVWMSYGFGITWSIAVLGGAVKTFGGEVLCFEWVATVANVDGGGWVLRARQKLTSTGYELADPPGSTIVDGRSTATASAVNSRVIGDGAVAATPNALMLAASNTANVVVNQTSVVTATTANTTATELTQDGAAGSGTVNRGVVLQAASVLRQAKPGMYRLEANIWGRNAATGTNTWCGTRVAHILTNGTGVPTIIATETVGADQVNGVTAPAAIAFASVGGGTNAVSLTVTPGAATSTIWNAALTLRGVTEA